MTQLRKNRVHRKVMNKRDEFINSDDFDHDEALEAAVDKKKFLLKRLLKDNTFIEGENASAAHRSRRAGAGAGVLTYFAGAGAGVCSPPVKL